MNVMIQTIVLPTLMQVGRNFNERATTVRVAVRERMQ
jgi:hypothetical protein